ncbi:MAG: tail fiber protein [Deltaproteobacteria bacterium]|nr:tail fiber protein [Deltaproteobacteria bacterium]
MDIHIHIPDSAVVGNKWRRGAAVGLLVLALGAASAVAFDFNLIKVFKAGDVIKADEVNANFKAVADAIHAAVPAGTILAWGADKAPAGFLLCDGAAYQSKNYEALAGVIGTAFGNGSKMADGKPSTGTNFNVPDLRGRFLRGADGGSGRDPDAAGRKAMNDGGAAGPAVGSVQSHALDSHNHYYAQEAKGGLNGGGSRFPTITDGSPTDAVNKATGGNETRPINAAVNYIIKY